MDGTERIRPSSWYYLLALAFFLGGLATAIFVLITDLRRVRDSMVRCEIPGHMDLELKAKEIYTVFAEDVGSSAGGALSRANSSRYVNCEVHMLPSGELIPAKRSIYSSSYTYGTRTGVSILEFNVPRDGTYMLGCVDNRGKSAPKLEAAIGGNASKAISGVFVKALFVLGVSIVAGTLTSMRVAMLRLQSRREIREQGLQPV